MTNLQFAVMQQHSRYASLHRMFSERSFPSRRAAKSTSHGDMRIKEKKMKIIPGIRIER